MASNNVFYTGGGVVPAQSSFTYNPFDFISLDGDSLRPTSSCDSEMDLLMPDFTSYGRFPLASEPQPSGKQDNFLTKLWNYITDHPNSEIIYWSDIGSYLIIPSEDAIVNEVVLKLYKQKDYSSFARQLNIYGWKRVNPSQLRGAEAQAFPPNSRIWRHDFLTRTSTVADVNKVKRNAVSKKKVRTVKSPPAYVLPQYLVQEATSSNPLLFGRRRSYSASHAQYISAARMLSGEVDTGARPSSDSGLPSALGHADGNFRFPQTSPLTYNPAFDNCLSPELLSGASSATSVDATTNMWSSYAAFSNEAAETSQSYVPRNASRPSLGDLLHYTLPETSKPILAKTESDTIFFT